MYGRSINASGVVVASIDSIDEDTGALSAILEDGEGRILNEEVELPSGSELAGVIKINDERHILSGHERGQSTPRDHPATSEEKTLRAAPFYIAREAGGEPRNGA